MLGLLILESRSHTFKGLPFYQLGLKSYFLHCIRRGGRVVEGARLESVYPGKTGIAGSNPALSAIF